jgi:hypothetical protein
MELSDLPLGLSGTAAIQQAIGVYRQELQWISTTKPPSTIVSPPPVDSPAAES